MYIVIYGTSSYTDACMYVYIEVARSISVTICLERSEPKSKIIR